MSAPDQSENPARLISASGAALLNPNVAVSQPTPPIAHVGTVMIQEGLMLPDGFVLDSDRYTNGWRAARTTDGFGVDRNLRSAGWHMFSIAGGTFRATAWGSAGSGLRRTMIRLLGLVRRQWFNSAEVAAISKGHFLGIPYTSVTINARHIQPGYLLANERSRARAQQNTDWARN